MKIVNSYNGFASNLRAVQSTELSNDDLLFSEYNRRGICYTALHRPLSDAVNSIDHNLTNINKDVLEKITETLMLNEVIYIVDNGKEIITLTNITENDDTFSFEFGGENYELPYSSLRTVKIKTNANEVAKLSSYITKNLELQNDYLGHDQASFLKIKGLAEAIGDCGDDCSEIYTKIQQRSSNMLQIVELLGVGIIDSEEDIVTINKDLTRYSKIIDHTLGLISAVSRVPKTILLGDSPKGFASGSHELENYKAFVSSVWQKHIETILTAIAELTNQKLKIKYTDIVKPTEAEILEEKIKEIELYKKRVEVLSMITTELDASFSKDEIKGFLKYGEIS